MATQQAPYFFKCSVSKDLYGACMGQAGAELPAPNGGKWLPIERRPATGYNPEAALKDIRLWGCHWFTSDGPRQINWGPNGPPLNQTSFA